MFKRNRALARWRQQRARRAARARLAMATPGFARRLCGRVSLVGNLAAGGLRAVRCTMPAGSTCPDCGRCLVDYAGE